MDKARHGNTREVQKRAVNCVTSLKSKSYEDKLRELGLTTLQARWDRGDAITIFKIINGLDDVGNHKYFEFVENNPDRTQTRHVSDRLNLKYKSFQTEIRHHSFSVREPRIWNPIPPFIKESRTLNEFKARYDRHQKELDYNRRTKHRR